jgi:hypothetical protein
LSWFRRKPSVKEPQHKTPYRARIPLPQEAPVNNIKEDKGSENGPAGTENRTDSNLYNKGS